MDIVHLLSTSLYMDVNQVAPEFTLPSTNYKLRVLDTLSGREVIYPKINHKKIFLKFLIKIFSEYSPWIYISVPENNPRSP